MLKKYTQTLLGSPMDMIYCDNCGEGISLDNADDIAEFCNLHRVCQKPKNYNLAFLQKAKPFKG
jgi:hypothetical protein